MKHLNGEDLLDPPRAYGFVPVYRRFKVDKFRFSRSFDMEFGFC